MNHNVIAIFGIPGSGKTTVSREAARILQGTWFSASKILRSHVELSGDPTCLSWIDYWARGESAPDQEVLPVLWSTYIELTRWPVLLDGYPRTLDQLTDFLSRGGTLDAGILLAVDDETALERISQRAGTSERSDDDRAIARDRISRDRHALKTLLSSGYIAGRLTRIDASKPADLLLKDLLKAVGDLTSQ